MLKGSVGLVKSHLFNNQPIAILGDSSMKVGDSSNSAGVVASDSSQPIAPKPGEPFTTQGGETLQSISQQAYGDDSMAAALSAIHGIPADKALPAGVNLNLPNQVKVNLEPQSTTLEVESEEDKQRRDAMSRNLNRGGALNDSLKRTMAGLDKPTIEMPKTVASEELKNKEVKHTVMGSEVSADLKGAELLSESSDTKTNEDGDSVTTASSTKTSIDSKGMKIEHKSGANTANADGSRGPCECVQPRPWGEGLAPEAVASLLAAMGLVNFGMLKLFKRETANKAPWGL